MIGGNISPPPPGRRGQLPNHIYEEYPIIPQIDIDCVIQIKRRDQTSNRLPPLLVTLTSLKGIFWKLYYFGKFIKVTINFRNGMVVTMYLTTKKLLRAVTITLLGYLFVCLLRKSIYRF